MNTWLAIAVAAAMITLGTSCGGNDPFTMFGSSTSDPSNSLTLPVPENLIGGVTAFTSSQDGIGISYNGGFGTTASVTAPLSGTIVNVDNTTNAGFVNVTIYHNARLSTKLSFLQITTVRQGDYVNTGDIVATIPSSGFGLTGLKLSVFVDGAQTGVCPFSYLSAAARTVYIAKNLGQFPCQ